ncbi:MAG TPA: hypothetical protein VIL37_19025 [Natronosporangium sp.]
MRIKAVALVATLVLGALGAITLGTGAASAQSDGISWAASETIDRHCC